MASTISDTMVEILKNSGFILFPNSYDSTFREAYRHPKKGIVTIEHGFSTPKIFTIHHYHNPAALPASDASQYTYAFADEGVVATHLRIYLTKIKPSVLQPWK